MSATDLGGGDEVELLSARGWALAEEELAQMGTPTTSAPRSASSPRSAAKRCSRSSSSEGHFPRRVLSSVPPDEVDSAGSGLYFLISGPGWNLQGDPTKNRVLLQGALHTRHCPKRPDIGLLHQHDH